MINPSSNKSFNSRISSAISYISFSFLIACAEAVLDITFRFSIPDLISSAICAGTSSGKVLAIYLQYYYMSHCNVLPLKC
ncbi:hypothetical protein AMS59_04815 [Lysinibacillus sp. FJAT-14745]|nr:hypothetical protein AMS59_04815 [Lysinibacillus sp. FJAT-14745]